MPTLTYNGLLVAAVNSANDDGAGGVDLELDQSQNLDGNGNPYYGADDVIEITIADEDVANNGEFQEAGGDGKVTVTSIKVNGVEILTANDNVKFGGGGDSFDSDAFFFVESAKLFFLSPVYEQDFSESVESGGKLELNVAPRVADLDINQNGSIDSATPEEGNGIFNIFAAQPGVVTDASDFADDATVTGGAGSETVYGGTVNNDPDSGGFDDDLISAGGGDDTIFAGIGTDSVSGDSGNDTLYAGDGADSLYGGTGADTFFGGNGDDVFFGGDGNDHFIDEAGNDTLTGGAGQDTFQIASGGGGFTVSDFDTTDSGDTVSQGTHSYSLGTDRIDSSALTDIGNGLTNQDGTVTADEITVTGGGGADQILTFPNGESIAVPDGTIDTSTPQTRFASLVAMGVPVCFTPGTLIATPDGERPVEDLAVGDTVSTRDAGPQVIRWIGVSHHAWPASPEKHKPIQIRAGALGDGLPRRDLAVSPQHRMLVSGGAVRALFGVDEVLAPAKGLTGLPGVRTMKGKRRVCYLSILLGAHHLLTAEGAATESFYPGPTALKMVPVKAALEIVTLFPGISKAPEKVFGPTVRQVLGVSDARRLADALRRDAECRRWDEDLARDRAPHLRIVS